MTNSVPVQFMFLDHGNDLPVPHYETEASAGMDLRAAVPDDAPITLKTGDVALVPTGFAMALPVGYEAQVRPRSGLAAKHSVTVLNTPGTIDADYRGEVKVILTNFGAEPFVVERGMRIAQMIIAPITTADWQVVKSLSETERGTGGFGSTGKK